MTDTRQRNYLYSTEFKDPTKINNKINNDYRGK